MHSAAPDNDPEQRSRSDFAMSARASQRDMKGCVPGPLSAFLKTFAVLLLIGRCHAGEFASARLLGDGRELELTRQGEPPAAAPRFEDQDGFAQPALAPDKRHVGWLALYPDLGASYSQPLELVVIDASLRVRRYRGKFGLVFGWCFADAGRAVVFMYNFAHGITPVAFEKRRVDNGRLLAHVQLAPIPAGEDETEQLRRRTPAWARCTLLSPNAAP